MNRGFAYFVGRLEEQMVAALVAASGGVQGYAAGSKPYDGELDDEELERESRSALSRLVGKTPLFFAAYAGGQDAEASAHPWIGGASRAMVHTGTFTVLCCAADSRGERKRQTAASQGVGVYRMIQDAQSALTGRQFEIEEEGGEKVILNDAPFLPVGRGDNVRYVLRTNELVVYAVHFETSFTWWTQDFGVEQPAVEAINFSVEPAGGPARPGGRPGVHPNS
ncbi:MAG TPA: phage protein Gp37 [Pyrinomonadaceae bacterium]